jgi:hypothetical protein
MTRGEFNNALRRARLGVRDGQIVDLSQSCPDFAVAPTFHADGTVDREATLVKVIRERDDEISRRANAKRLS